MKRGEFKKGGQSVFAAFIFALVYLALCSHVLVDVMVQGDGGACTIHAVLRAWGVSISLSGSRRKPPALERAMALRRYFPIIRAAVRTLHVGQVDLRARIGLEDAAATAILCGVIRSAADALLAVSGQVPRSAVRIDADYRAPVFLFCGRCIFSLIPGDIMFAAAKAAVKKTQREGFKWLSTPLRA